MLGKEHLRWTEINSCGTEGNIDPFRTTYPQDFVIDAVAMGSPDGFTVLDFKDPNGDGVYSDNDSLITTDT